MTALYNALKAQIQSKAPSIKYISIWNNQLDNLVDGKEHVFLTPAVLFEFVPSIPIGGIGNNVQIYERLNVRAHIVDFELDAKDGSMEKNVTIFDIKQEVYKALQLFKCDGSGIFDRQSEEPDYNHSNIYHYIQDYFTSWVDQDLPLPIGGIEVEPPFATEITPEID